MDREPVEIGPELRCGDRTRRASDSCVQSFLCHLKLMNVGCRPALCSPW